MIKSFKKDFLYKLLTNLVKIPINLILQLIFPRILGTVSFGNYDFLMDISNRILGFLDQGTSLAFFNRLSLNKKRQLLIKFYFALFTSISILFLFFIWASNFIGFNEKLWPDQDFINIFLSAVLGILIFVSSTCILMIDAFDLTVKGEKFRIIHLIFSCLVFGFLFFYFKKIELFSFFIFQILLSLFLICGIILIIKKSNFSFRSNDLLNKENIKEHITYFWSFSHPLIVYSLVSMITVIGGRWILQNFGGSVEQSYFALALKIGAIVFIFSNALMPLLNRRFVRLFEKLNLDELFKFYKNSSNLLLILSLYISVICFYNSEFITLILGGKEFVNASNVILIMSVYPIHQSLWQVNGYLFFSTNRNKIYRNIGILTQPISLILSFYFIAPEEYFGLNLGATGLALQYILIQILVVNIMVFYNFRFLKKDPINFYRNQIIFFLMFFSFGFIVNEMTFFLELKNLLSFITFCFIFSLIFVITILLTPNLFGFKNRQEMLNFIKIK
tara:strand:- start:4374 stop:5882 length:1509 start_codon:yes stop_codon:yes gene_type:complete